MLILKTTLSAQGKFNKGRRRMRDEVFSIGAVWHGPWHCGLVSGSFGIPARQHFAIRNSFCQKNLQDLCLSFFPFTSQYHKKALLVLSPGSVPFGNPRATPYILSLRLLVYKTDLRRRFSYKCRLNQKICDELKKRYISVIKNRKLRKKCQAKN